MDRTFGLAVFLGAFAWCCAHAGGLAQKAADADAARQNFVEGSDGYRFLPAELRFTDKLSSPDLSAMVAPAIAAIGDFAGQLEEWGVALLVVPVPPKALVHAGSLGITGDEQRSMRAGWEKIMGELSAQGVQVVDLLPDYLEAKDSVFCLRDTHWSGNGIEQAVQRLAPALQGAGISTKNLGTAPWKEISINGDLGGDPETVKLRFPAIPASNPSSPVLLLGDSHVLVFHQGGDLHASGAGLPEQLAAMLGAMPKVMGVRGSGATSSRVQLARHLRSAPGYLKDKKAVIWVFAGREFTEADMWKKISLIPPEKAKERP